MTILLCFLLCRVSPGELEARGRLVEAGAAWESRGDLEGQVRVMTRMLEDALYSADTRRAWLLSGELQGMGVERPFLDFWAARIAWSAGLRTEAVETLRSLSTQDPWLHHRARGLALLYGGDPREAVEVLTMAVSLSNSSRRGFYASLDLCTALLASGETARALLISQRLVEGFPHDPLARVMKGLCLQMSGSSAAALMELTTLAPGDAPGARAMAERLIREFGE